MWQQWPLSGPTGLPACWRMPTPSCRLPRCSKGTAGGSMTEQSDFRRRRPPTRTGVHSTSLSTPVPLWLPKGGGMSAGSAAPVITPPHSVHGGWTRPFLVPCQVPRHHSAGPGHRTAPHKYVAPGTLGLAGSRLPATSYTSAACATRTTGGWTARGRQHQYILRPGDQHHGPQRQNDRHLRSPG